MKPNNKQTKKLQKLVLGLATIFASGVLCTNAMAEVLDSPAAAPVQPSPDANASADHHVKLASIKIVDPYLFDELNPDMSTGNGGIDIDPDSFVSSAQLEQFARDVLAEDALHSWVALETSMQSTEVDQLQKISVLLTAICASDAHCKIADAGL